MTNYVLGEGTSNAWPSCPRTLISPLLWVSKRHYIYISECDTRMNTAECLYCVFPPKARRQDALLGSVWFSHHSVTPGPQRSRTSAPFVHQSSQPCYIGLPVASYSYLHHFVWLYSADTVSGHIYSSCQPPLRFSQRPVSPPCWPAPATYWLSSATCNSPNKATIQLSTEFMCTIQHINMMAAVDPAHQGST